MKLSVVTVGRPRTRWARQGCEEYRKRCGRVLPVEWRCVAEEKGSGAPGRMVSREGDRIMGILRERDTVILCHEAGREYTSEEFASWLFRRLETAEGRLVLCIGGAYGVSEAVRERAKEELSLSRCTLPHELAAVVLFEQLYRASTIHRGTGYHH
ncbi:MAG: 23S rRNA (pseudouridine(1915)-N(3))-methyltransferase RlmH [Synergistales bacterium]|nr:23S rRNA (pseudouridine(1915)-N(3))-methyltransferase RlmH [Synergistales bacterium]